MAFLPSKWKARISVSAMNGWLEQSPVKAARKMVEEAKYIWEEEFSHLNDLRADIDYAVRAESDDHPDAIYYVPVGLDELRDELAKQKRAVKRAAFERVLAESRLELAPVYEAAWQEERAETALAALSALFASDAE